MAGAATYAEPVYEEPAYEEPAYEEAGYAEAAYDDGSGGAAASGGSYLVQSGDTLTGIAAELGTSVDSLMAANGLTDPDLLYAGQTLTY
jgi:LysM repeat protein